MGILQTPYIIYGIFYDKNGSVVAGGSITATNLATGNTISITSNSVGQFAIDCANFEQGYRDGDTIKLSGSSSSSPDYILEFSVDAGKTWMELNNSFETNVSANTTRFKLNQTTYPGGRINLNITLIA